MIPTTLESAFERVKELVDDFSANEKRYKSPEYQEAEVRKDFIDKFFIALGWDVNHDHQKNPYEQEVKVERKPDRKNQRRADYAFFISPDYRDARFFVEAKKPSISLFNAQDYLQTILYGWHANTPIAALTDFEEFHILDCRYKPDIAIVLSRKLKQFNYHDYTNADTFAEIYYLFSREAVHANSLEKYAESLPATKIKSVQQGLFAGVQSIDESFLEELDSIRKRLAKAFKKNNPDWDSELLTEATQRTIDRLVFMRFLEDKLIEPDDILARLGAKHSIWTDFATFSKKLNAKYNGIVFKEHFIDSTSCNGPDEREFISICQELERNNSIYQFDKIPIHILGSIYERFLGQVVIATEKTARVESKPEVRKAGGVNYTPQYIVRYIVDNTVGKLIENKTPKEISRMRFADISCGSGSFLISVFETLIYHLHLWYQAHPVDAEKDRCHFVDGKWVLTLKQKQKLLTDCIYGVDIDSQAVEVTQLSLYLKLLEDETTATSNEMQVLFKEKILPDLSRNIVNGNSLIERDRIESDLFNSDDERKIHPLDFSLAFPHVMHDGGFDAIVGNPPYVRQEGLGKEFKDYMKKHYESFAGTADLYIYFIERAHRLLKKNGFFGMICSNKFMRSNYGKALRKFITEKSTIKEIIDFGELPVFQGVATFPAIILTRNDISKKQNFTFAQIKRLSFTSLSDEVDNVGIELDHRSLSSENWSLTNSIDISILKKMKLKSVGLYDYVEGKIYFGIKTGFDKGFVINEKIKDELLNKDPMSKEIIRPYVLGDDVRKYHVNFQKKYLILFPKGWTKENIKGASNVWSGVRRRYPAIADYLDQNSVQAKKRWDQGDYWWELRACDYYSEFEKPKIVYPDIAKESRFAFDDKKLFMAATTFSIPINDKYLLGILNSKLIFFCLSIICPVLGDANKGGRLRLKTVYLKNLPIRKIDFSNLSDKTLHDKIVSLVEQMLTSKKQLSESKSDRDKNFFTSKCESLDHQINECVYELYGLNEEERKTIEDR